MFKIGIIGGGMYGKVHVRWFQADGRAVVTWVCNHQLQNAQAAAIDYGIPHATADYREILADPAVTAVVIAVPPYLHTEILVTALAAGKHVLVEKPLAARRVELDVILQAAADHPELVVLDASCRHTRFQPKFQFVKQFVDSGKLGTIYHIHHQHLSRTTFVEYNPAGAWGVSKAMAGGGPFLDWGVYDLAFHLGLLDDVPQIKTVRSFTRAGLHDVSRFTSVADVEQHGAAWMEFDTGLNYYYERGAGVHGETPCETRLHGTLGSLRFEFPTWESPVAEFYYEVDGVPQKETLVMDLSARAPDDNQPLVAHFLDCLEGTASPAMPVTLAAKHLEILFDILGEP